MADMTEEDLAGLTDEERAGLLVENDGPGDGGNASADGGSENGTAVGAKNDGQGGSADGGDGQPGSVGEASQVAQGDSAAAGEPAQAGEAGAEAQPGELGDKPDAPQRAAAPVPLFGGDKPEAGDAKARLDEIGTREAELDEQFDAGAMSAADYRAAARKLSDERDEIRWQQRKAEIDAAAVRQQQELAWYADVNAFLSVHPDVGRSNLRMQAFDASVRQATGDSENAGLTNQEVLEKAYSRWVEELGIEPKSPAAQEKPAAKPSAKPEKDPATRELPPTLAKVPAAEVPATGDGRFAALMRLQQKDPIAYEDAYAKLSDADRDAFLAGAG